MLVFDRIVLGLISLVVSLLVPSIFTSFGGLSRTPGWSVSFWDMHDPVSVVAIALVALVFYTAARIFIWLHEIVSRIPRWKRIGLHILSAFALGVEGFAHVEIRVFMTHISAGTSGKSAALAVEALRGSPAFLWECLIVGALLAAVVRIHPAVAEWLIDHRLLGKGELRVMGRAA